MRNQKRILKFSWRLAVIFLALTTLLLNRPFLTIGDDSAGVSDLATKKDVKHRQLLEIQSKLANLQKQITEQRGKIASLKNELKLDDLQIQQTEQRIAELTTQIELTNTDIIEVLGQISVTEENIRTKQEILAILLREIYRADRVSPLQIILQNNSFSEILNQFQSTIAYQDATRALLQDLADLKTELEAKQRTLNEQKTELEGLKGQSVLTEQNLLNERQQKQILLSTTRGQESRYQQLLGQVSEEEAKINREIYNLDLEIRQRLGDKSLPPVAGAMTWPMEGILTQGYGNTGFTSLGYTFHNGIDIAAPANTTVHAAADGVVFAAGTGRTAYGNWVVVRHALKSENGSIKNVMTLYAHLSTISVSIGRGVLRGDMLGLQGNTGNTTRLLYGPERGYHLHFTIFDEEGFDIKDGVYSDIYGPYQIPYGYTYNPMQFLR